MAPRAVNLDRDCRLVVRLHKDELAALKDEAELHGISVSTLVRACCGLLDVNLYPRQHLAMQVANSLAEAKASLATLRDMNHPEL